MAVSSHATLTAATVATVTVDRVSGTVQVIGRDAVDEIFYTVDGTTPAVGAAGTYMLPAVISSAVHINVPYNGSNEHTVKLISTTTPSYSVQAF